LFLPKQVERDGVGVVRPQQLLALGVVLTGDADNMAFDVSSYLGQRVGRNPYRFRAGRRRGCRRG
jgi:hypothetical protein